jgi:hypothetical protein
MYAKLVVGGTDANIIQCMRDICRLCTDAAPSISDLSGAGFSNTTSAIIDSTPAGWTYVGSNKATDTPNIGSGGSDATIGTTSSTLVNLCMSAPMADDPAKLKYAILTQAFWGSSGTTPYKSMFALTGAQSVTSGGVATNEGFRQASGSTGGSILDSNLHVGAGSIIHLIANPRHITIVQETKGIMAVWETTSTEAHTFYNRPAYVTYSHAKAAEAARGSINTTPTPFTGTTNANFICGVVFNTTDPNTGTTYGTYEVSINGVQNLGSLYQVQTSARANSIDSVGNPKYQISPVFFQLNTIGQATQYVSGVVPVYWCKAGLGSTGDNVNISGDSYIYFNAANAGGGFGLLMKTD